MKKSRGFTLVELLAVIVILAVILVIAIPNVMKIIDKARLDTYKRTEGMLTSATRSYLASNNIAFTENVPVAIDYTTLRDNNYIDKIYDQTDSNVATKECVNSKVYVTKVGNNYTYKSGLVCTNYISLDTFNMVSNGDFSNGTAGYSFWQQSYISVDNTFKLNNHNTVKGTYTGTVSDNGINQDIIVTNGNVVFLQGYFYDRKNPITNVKMLAVHDYATFNNIFQVTKNGSSNNWESIYLRRTIANGGVRISLRQYTTSADYSIGEFILINLTDMGLVLRADAEISSLINKSR